MKKLLAVLCFVPVGFCLYVIIHASIIDPKGPLIMLGVIVVGVIVYEATALGARLWRGDKPKNGYVLIDGERYPASDAFQLASRWSSNELYYRTKQNDTWEPWVEFGETMKSINSHLHKNKEDSCSTKS